MQKWISRVLPSLFMLVMITTVSTAQRNTLAPDSFQINADSQISPGQTFVVEVAANITTPAYGFGFQIQYDPAYMTPALRPDKDGESSYSVLEALFPDAQRISATINELTTTRHEIDVVYTLLSPAPVFTGDGSLISFAFEVTDLPDDNTTTTITIENPRLIGLDDNQGVDIPLNAGNLSITIEGNAIAPTATLRPPATATIEATTVPTATATTDPSITSTPDDDDNDDIMDSSDPLLFVGIIIIMLLVIIVILLVYMSRNRQPAQQSSPTRKKRK
ncbi:MAG: cohesin domain-containing protein [Aggregatilineales bacterium]